MVDKNKVKSDNSVSERETPFWEYYNYTAEQWALKQYIDRKDCEMWQNSPWEREFGEANSTEFN